MTVLNDIACDIVMVCKDDQRGLSESLKSLFQQNYDNWKALIVIPWEDSSLEGSSFFLEDPRVSVLRDAGLGIYSAMNQALMSVESSYVWFLNAGDQFFGNDALRFAIAEIVEHSADLLIGDFVLVSSNRKKFRFPNVVGTREVSSRLLAASINRTCHQSSLFRVPQEGPQLLTYDVKYPLAADFELMLRITSSKKSVLTEKVLAAIQGNGLSDQSIAKVWIERGQIRRSFFPVFGFFWTSIMECAFKVYSRCRSFMKSEK
jgi:glycosyltransferase involved in cell wall biosynthesis